MRQLFPDPPNSHEAGCDCYGCERAREIQREIEEKARQDDYHGEGVA